MTSRRIRLVSVCLAVVSPALLGARGSCGSSPIFSMTPAPNVAGTWDIAYDDTLGIRVTIGGAVYESTIGAAGGTVTIDHAGRPIRFQIDCARPEIQCPSETFAPFVEITQRDAEYPHRMYVNIPRQYCMGTEVTPPASECGRGTLNPSCDPVCEGEVGTRFAETFGVIDEPGERFGVLLGSSIATNGVNCVLLGVSHAEGDLVTTGRAESADWEAHAIEGGIIQTAYAGGCLWAGDPDDDGTLEALVVGASVSLTTGFTATRR